MLRRQTLAFLFLAGFGLAAQAQEAPQAGPKAPAVRERCADGPMGRRHQEFCKDNPQRCEELKAKRDQMREQCKQDPAACEKKREEMRAKMKQRMEERCKADPARCETMKKRFEERQVRGERRGPPPVAVPNPSSN